MLLTILSILCSTTTTTIVLASQPHIILIVSDDMGYNDIEYINSNVLTPEMRSLAEAGTIFNNSYVQPMCSPSRGALLTGKYPFRIGLNHGAIGQRSPVGVSTSHRFLPEILKTLNYTTHMIGKWHLGFCNASYTPLERGFDTFLGFYSGHQGYYDHRTDGGYDFWNDTDPLLSAEGKYSTTLFGESAVELIRNREDPDEPMFLYLSFQAAHTPAEVDSVYEDMYDGISSARRRIYSAQITAMDYQIKDIVLALKDRGMYNDSLIVFTSDNGRTALSSGDNLSLKGGKKTIWEGGVRVPTFVHGRMLADAGSVNDGLFHVTDWFPTILEAAGDDDIPSDIDGLSQWDYLTGATSASPRTEFVYNVIYDRDDNQMLQGGLRQGRYKLLVGDPEFDVAKDKTDWIDGNANTAARLSLYDIEDDPTETTDVKDQHPTLVVAMRDRLEELATTRVDPLPSGISNEADPSNFGGLWSSGWCDAV